MASQISITFGEMAPAEEEGDGGRGTSSFGVSATYATRRRTT